MSIPVLMYHHILPNPGYITVTVANFRQQMEWLKENDYHTLSANEFALIMSGQIKKPKKAVLITFDDGWKDNFIYAYPILKSCGHKAVLFTVTKWIEAASLKQSIYKPLDHYSCIKALNTSPEQAVCSWTELKLMSDVFTFSPHTHSHDIENLTNLNTWKEDLLTNIDLLKKHLAKHSRTDFLCWPRGKYNSLLVNLAKDLGFNYLFTCNRGPNIPLKSNGAIKRLVAKDSQKWIHRACSQFSNRLIATILSWLKPQ